MNSAATEKADTATAVRRLRKGLLSLHLCLALLLGLYFSLMGLTGSTLVFKTELHRLFKPAAYFVNVPANAEPLPLDSLVKVFNEGHPGSSLSFMTLPTEASQALIIGYKLKTPGQKGAQSRQTIIDPYSGKIVAEQLSGGWFFRTVHNLHARLLLDDLGEEVHRFAVFGIFALLLSGSWLWWSSIAGLVVPFKMHKVLTQLKQKISIKLNGTFSRKIFDTHNAVGFFAGSILFVLALTASSDLWRDQAKVIVAVLTGGSLASEGQSAKDAVEPRKSKEISGVKEKIQPSYDAMLITAKSALPNMVAVAITDKLRVRMVNLTEQYVIPRCITVVCNQSDASLQAIEDPAKMPLDQQIMAWMLPVHFGQWGPGASYYFVKALWFLVGLSPSVLFISGVIMYLLKKKNLKHS
ncbi:hypothetical protein BH11CYA1_BH11CYA1_39290 [soil metagenome]